VDQSGSGATTGVQSNSANFTQFSCNTSSVSNGLMVSYLLNICPPTAIPTITLTPTPTPPCSPSWQVVTTPNFGSDENELYDIAAVGPNDVWAIGYIDSGDVRATLT